MAPAKLGIPTELAALVVRTLVRPSQARNLALVVLVTRVTRELVTVTRELVTVTQARRLAPAPQGQARPWCASGERTWVSGGA